MGKLDIPFKCKRSKNRNLYEVLVEGDFNDGDDAEKITLINKDKFESSVGYHVAYLIDNLHVDIDRLHEDDEGYTPMVHSMVAPKGTGKFETIAYPEIIPMNGYGYPHTIHRVEVIYYDEEGIPYIIDNKSISKVCQYDFKYDPKHEL